MNTTSAQTTLNANDLKVSGVTAIESALSHAPEVFIAVRGDPRYVVMRASHYDYLRDCELEAAWLATQADIANGHAKTMTANAHIADMQSRILQSPIMSAPAHTVQQTRTAYLMDAQKVQVKAKPRKKAR